MTNSLSKTYTEQESDGKMKKGWKPFFPQKYFNTGFRGK
jgi:hypothetical protein